MPDFTDPNIDVSKLTASETQRALDLVNGFAEKHGPHVCPICKSQEWILDASYAEIRPHHMGSMIVGCPVYPMIMLYCKTCGFTRFINAIYTKVLDPKEREQDAKQ